MLCDIIQQYVALDPPNHAGWQQLVCQVCNDHSKRAAFNFNEGISYNCFNCGFKFKIENDQQISNRIKKTLKLFGVPEEEIIKDKGLSFFSKQEQTLTLESITKKDEINLKTPEIELPPLSYRVGSNLHPNIEQKVKDYLSQRKINHFDINAFYSLDPKFEDRVIIPCFRNSKIIYWQARHIGNKKPRYISPYAQKDAILWGYDNLYGQKNLFITEGIFDAYFVNGVAILGSKLNQSKLHILRNNKCNKIVVIDKDNRGEYLGELALKENWQITFVDDGANDINDSVIKFGKAYTIYSLLKNRNTAGTIKTPDNVDFASLLKLKLGVM